MAELKLDLTISKRTFGSFLWAKLIWIHHSWSPKRFLLSFESKRFISLCLCFGSLVLKSAAAQFELASVLYPVLVEWEKNQRIHCTGQRLCECMRDNKRMLSKGDPTQPLESNGLSSQKHIYSSRCRLKARKTRSHKILWCWADSKTTFMRNS